MDHDYDLGRTDYPMEEKPDKPNGYRATSTYEYKQETPANENGYDMDHTIKRPGKERPQSDGNWTPSMSLQNLSNPGSQINTIADDD